MENNPVTQTNPEAEAGQVRKLGIAGGLGMLALGVAVAADARYGGDWSQRVIEATNDPNLTQNLMQLAGASLAFTGIGQVGRSAGY